MAVGRVLAVATLMTAAHATAALGSEEAERLLEGAAQDCRDYENGVFTASPTAITAVDLTGDPVDDEIVDTGLFVCSSTDQMFCGSVGCSIHAIVDGKRFSWIAYSWTVVDWQTSRILLLSRHGDICASGPDAPCYEALVWNGDRFVTVGSPPIQPIE